VSALSPDQIVSLAELLVVLMGIGITWAVYRGSENAELPGDALLPDPNQTDDTVPDTRGRTL
jgi:hypothetical protein